MKTSRAISIMMTMAILFTHIIPTYAFDVSLSVSENESSSSGVVAKGDANYIVLFKTEGSKNKVVRGKDKKVKRQYKKKTLLAIELTEKEAQELSLSADVAYVEKDAPAQIMSIGDKSGSKEIKKKQNKNDTQVIPWGINYIGADMTLQEYDGKNVKVAVFDTGVSEHEDILLKG